MQMIKQIASELAHQGIVLTYSNTTVGENELMPEERAQIANATRARRREFATGRWCARQGLSRLGFNEPIPIPINLWGYPEWPPGVTGSITHTDNFYCVALADKSKVRSVGIDIEPAYKIIKNHTFDIIADQTEQQYIGRLPELPPHLLRLICFSAKESFFKALSPIIDKHFYFDAVRIVEINGTKEGNFRLEVNQSLCNDFHINTDFSGRYFIDSEWVFTYFIILNS